MKKIINFALLLSLLTLYLMPNIEAKQLAESRTVTKYFKTIEYYNNEESELNLITSTNILPMDYESISVELNKDDYYKEISSPNSNLMSAALTSITETSSYKKLTLSYEPSTNGKYRVTAKVDWDVMPYYRKIDHLGTTHTVMSTANLQCGILTYTKGGKNYTSENCNPPLYSNEYWWTYGQFVDHNLPNNDLFGSVTDIKFQISYETIGNPGADLAAVIYHQDISSTPSNNLYRYFMGPFDIKLGGNAVNMGYYFSIQYVSF